MNKKLVNIINAFCIVVAVVLAGVYAHVGNPWVFKTLATSWFLLMGTFNIIVGYKNQTLPNLYKVLMIIGLVFAAAGDLFLIPKSTFVIGAILFAIGHVFYFVAFCLITKPRWTDLVLFVIIATASILVICLVPGFDFQGMFAIIIVYAIIISAMLAKAIGNAITSKFTLQNVFVALGAVMFFVSDLCLLFDMFHNVPHWVDHCCLYTYYGGQALLASSLSFINQPKQIKE